VTILASDLSPYRRRQVCRDPHHTDSHLSAAAPFGWLNSISIMTIAFSLFVFRYRGISFRFSFFSWSVFRHLLVSERIPQASRSSANDTFSLARLFFINRKRILWVSLCAHQAIRGLSNLRGVIHLFDLGECLACLSGSFLLGLVFCALGWALLWLCFVTPAFFR